jgi:hypothetical protein
MSQICHTVMGAASSRQREPPPERGFIEEPSPGLEPGTPSLPCAVPWWSPIAASRWGSRIQGFSGGGFARRCFESTLLVSNWFPLRLERPGEADALAPYSSEERRFWLTLFGGERE